MEHAVEPGVDEFGDGVGLNQREGAFDAGGDVSGDSDLGAQRLG